jgi:2,3-dihydroxybenzoate-AMP ligase
MATLLDGFTPYPPEFVARYKLPEYLELVDTFPLSNVGKVSKLALTQLIAEKLAAEQKE